MVSLEYYYIYIIYRSTNVPGAGGPGLYHAPRDAGQFAVGTGLPQELATPSPRRQESPLGIQRFGSTQVQVSSQGSFGNTAEDTPSPMLHDAQTPPEHKVSESPSPLPPVPQSLVQPLAEEPHGKNTGGGTPPFPPDPSNQSQHEVPAAEGSQQEPKDGENGGGGRTNVVSGDQPKTTRIPPGPSNQSQHEMPKPPTPLKSIYENGTYWQTLACIVACSKVGRNKPHLSCGSPTPFLPLPSPPCLHPSLLRMKRYFDETKRDGPRASAAALKVWNAPNGRISA